MPEPIIDFKDVEIHRRELVVLKHIDLVVEPGEMLYMMGRVGSGKSSLLKSLYAEVPVFSAKKAQIFNYSLTALRRRDIPMLRRRIGIVFQDFQLLTDRSVKDNLLFVLHATGWQDRREADRRADEVLRNASMLKKSYKMPHELSGGEQQRVVIARALLNKPRLILADEPTGNLDPDSSAVIVEQLHEIAQRGTAVIMATHNSALVEKYPARTLLCNDKRIIVDNEARKVAENSYLCNAKNELQ